MEKNPLSVAIITKNEEKNIRICLDSIVWFDEIIVLDSGNADATLRIASEFNCGIYSEEWRGFGIHIF